MIDAIRGRGGTWRAILLLMVIGAIALLASGACGEEEDVGTSTGSVSGELKKWHPMAISFPGPDTSESATSPNPFLDYRLQVTFTGPDGQAYDVPGFFDGGGNGGESGNVWRVRFAPNQDGTWTYKASFRTGPNIAVDTDSSAGSTAHFDGDTGSFEVAGRPRGSWLSQMGLAGIRRGTLPEVPGRPVLAKGRRRQPGERPRLPGLRQHAEREAFVLSSRARLADGRSCLQQQ